MVKSTAFLWYRDDPNFSRIPNGSYTFTFEWEGEYQGYLTIFAKYSSPTPQGQCVNDLKRAIYVSTPTLKSLRGDQHSLFSSSSYFRDTKQADDLPPSLVGARSPVRLFLLSLLMIVFRI